MVEPYKHRFLPGQKVFEFTLVHKLPDIPRNRSVNMRHRWRVQCSCGEFRDIPSYYLTRKNPLTNCGQCKRTLSAMNAPIYRIWLLMHKRCEDVGHVSYKYYGGRGIKVCPEWSGEDGFKNFLEYIGERPSMRYSIDRVNNNLGYQPFQEDGVTRQVRWATMKEQRANQGPRRTLTQEKHCTYPNCNCAISFPEGYKPSEATECPAMVD